MRRMLDWPRNVSEVGSMVRRLPVGAELQPPGGTHFRIWAPRCRSVMVQIRSQAGQSRELLTLTAEENGYFSGLHTEAAAGDLYWFLLDDDGSRLPDPASRFQPQGPHGPSEIIDPGTYMWGDANWQGVQLP